MNPTNVPRTLVELPGIGRIVSSCSFGGSGNTRAELINTSGKELIAVLVGARNAGAATGDATNLERILVPDGADGGSTQLIGTGGSTTSRWHWILILPSSDAARPQAFGTVTAQHGCGKTTAQLVSTER